MTISFTEREDSTYEFLAISSAAVYQLVSVGDTAMIKGKSSYIFYLSIRSSHSYSHLKVYLTTLQQASSF